MPRLFIATTCAVSAFAGAHGSRAKRDRTPRRAVRLTRSGCLTEDRFAGDELEREMLLHDLAHLLRDFPALTTFECSRDEETEQLPQERAFDDGAMDLGRLLREDVQHKHRT